MPESPGAGAGPPELQFPLGFVQIRCPDAELQGENSFKKNGYKNAHFFNYTRVNAFLFLFDKVSLAIVILNTAPPIKVYLKKQIKKKVYLKFRSTLMILNSHE